MFYYNYWNTYTNSILHSNRKFDFFFHFSALTLYKLSLRNIEREKNSKGHMYPTYKIRITVCRLAYRTQNILTIIHRKEKNGSKAMEKKNYIS